MIKRYLTQFRTPLSVLIPNGPTSGVSRFMVGKGGAHVEKIEQDEHEVRVYDCFGCNIVFIAGGWGFFTAKDEVKAEKEQKRADSHAGNGAKGGATPNKAPSGLLAGSSNRKGKKKQEDDKDKDVSHGEGK